MKQRIILAVLGAGIFGGMTSGFAQFYTIAPGGPSGYLPDAVYTPFGPPPLAGPGALPVLLPPPPPNPAGPVYIVDALSSGTEAGGVYLFSVTAGAAGLPGSPVFFETAFGTPPSQFFPGPPVGPLPPEAAGDIFVTPPLPVFGIPGLAGPVPPGTLIGADEFMLGLNVGPPPGAPDDLNALVLRVPPMGIGTFYYSLGVGGLGPGFYLPGDIISPLLPLGVPWAPSFLLGLDSLGPGTDDIDALLIQDLGIFGVYEPGLDFVAFSLTPGSATLGLLGYAPGTGGGDLFVPPVGPGLPGLFIPGAAFGLAPMDNLDAIDVVPEPSAVPLLLAGFGLVGLCFWQRRRFVA